MRKVESGMSFSVTYKDGYREILTNVKSILCDDGAITIRYLGDQYRFIELSDVERISAIPMEVFGDETHEQNG